MTSDLKDKANAPNPAADYVANYQQDYLIYGIGQPCNRYNNNTGTATKAPNCNQITTSIVLAPGGFTPPAGETPPPLDTSRGRTQHGDGRRLVVRVIICCLLINVFVSI